MLRRFHRTCEICCECQHSLSKTAKMCYRVPSLEKVMNICLVSPKGVTIQWLTSDQYGVYMGVQACMSIALRLAKMLAFKSPSITILHVTFRAFLQSSETKFRPLLCVDNTALCSDRSRALLWLYAVFISSILLIGWGSSEIFWSSKMSDRGPNGEALKKPRRKKKPPRLPKSRRGRPAKYQFIWQLMADEARLAKMMKQTESVDGIVDAWTPATEGATTTGLQSSSTNSRSMIQIDSNSDQHMKCELDLIIQ